MTHILLSLSGVVLHFPFFPFLLPALLIWAGLLCVHRGVRFKWVPPVLSWRLWPDARRNVIDNQSIIQYWRLSVQVIHYTMYWSKDTKSEFNQKGDHLVCNRDVECGKVSQKLLCLGLTAEKLCFLHRGRPTPRQKATRNKKGRDELVWAGSLDNIRNRSHIITHHFICMCENKYCMLATKKYYMYKLSVMWYNGAPHT